jgi:glycyl-tRNA synthetase beta chain
MAELLLELLSEEIPARMQARAAEDLHRLAITQLAAAQLSFNTVQSFVGARRLVLVVEGLPLAQPDTIEERRGPRVGAPEAAIQGFLKSAGIASLAECEERDTGKGVFYIATIRRAGRPTAEILPEILRGAILDLPWPKSMRFPAAGSCRSISAEFPSGTRRAATASSLRKAFRSSISRITARSCAAPM